MAGLSFPRVFTSHDIVTVEEHTFEVPHVEEFTVKTHIIIKQDQCIREISVLQHTTCEYGPRDCLDWNTSGLNNMSDLRTEFMTHMSTVFFM